MQDKYIENMRRGKYLDLRTKIHASLIFSSVFLFNLTPLKKIEEPRMIFSEKYVNEYIKSYFKEKEFVKPEFGGLENDTLESYNPVKLKKEKENYLIFENIE